MALIDITNLGLDLTFRARVQAAILVRAIAIEVEGSGVTGHTQRLAVATAVLHDPATYAAAAAVAIATVTAIQTPYLVNHQSSDVSDALIQAAANSDPLWNVLAGV